jgi:fluoroacetyl-CoA thioesterase
MDLLKPGILGEAKTVVSDQNTAITHGSGSIPVFATPAMIALMENAALSSVQPLLPEGNTTVGIKITSSHIAATPLGMEVVVKSELTDVDGKRLVFKIEAFDAKEKIGEGTHERFVINIEKFMKKNNEKKDY